MPDPVRIPLHAPLTPMELRIVRLVAAQQSQDDIADALDIAPRTVEYHVANIVRKIPGNLPRAGRIMAWWRGAPLSVLEGERISGLQIALWKTRGA